MAADLVTKNGDLSICAQGKYGTWGHQATPLLPACLGASIPPYLSLDDLSRCRLPLATGWQLKPQGPSSPLQTFSLLSL